MVIRLHAQPDKSRLSKAASAILPMQVKRPLARALNRTRQFAHPQRLSYVFRKPHDNVDVDRHIQEALAWLCRAQDAGNDDGVARSATIGSGRFDPSYPETTGYIIPTMLTAATRYDKPEYRERAERMGRWLFTTQMSCGALPGGTDLCNPAPAVFNTGQILLGWNRLYDVINDNAYKMHAHKAAQWLVDIQEPNGDWIKGHSECATIPSPTYNLRVAWGLCETGTLLQSETFVNAARNYVQCALRKQRSNGWYEDCCLNDARRPLTHTLAYAARGTLECGLLLDDDDFIAAARCAADAMLSAVQPNGFLPGRLDEQWRAAAKWCCLTGSAQTSIIFSKLFSRTGVAAYRDAAARINDYLMRRHDITSDDPTIRGGLFGSWPVAGQYNPFAVLNWAAKFLIDALIEHEQSNVAHG